MLFNFNKKIEKSFGDKVSLTLQDPFCSMRVIPQGKTTVQFADTLKDYFVGVLPMQKTKNVKSKGLKWELKPGVEFGFGGIVSTSNRLKGNKVEFESDQPLLLSLNFNDKTPSS